MSDDKDKKKKKRPLDDYRKEMEGVKEIDHKGEYGISNRDNYIILRRTRIELCMIRYYLSTRFARYLFEATRYRMKYLEKSIFELLPDITKFYNKNKTFEIQVYVMVRKVK